MAGYNNINNHAIAYAGNIEIVSEDTLSDYYRCRQVLIPPQEPDTDIESPLYLVTANCLIYKKAIEAIDGFNESFKQAGGEDVDLAWRLKSVGELRFCWKSITRHEFEDGFKGLVKRFIRYGRGNKQLGFFHKLPMFPQFPTFKKQKVSHFIFASIEYLSMIYGYYLGEIK